MQLQVSFDQIASNVIKYIWPGGSNYEIRARITGRQDRIEVEIVDDGVEFDPQDARSFLAPFTSGSHVNTAAVNKAPNLRHATSGEGCH